MKSKNAAIFSVLAVALSTAFVAPMASAADGLINFEGSITAQSCTINGGAGKDFTVTLPKVSAKALETVGSWAGRTPFSIDLTNCGDPLTGQVAVHFEPGLEVDLTTGRLKVDPGAGTASNVQVAVLNSDFSDIRIGQAVSNSRPANLVNGAFKFDYYAQYVSLGTATAGGVKTRVNYTIVYP